MKIICSRLADASRKLKKYMWHLLVNVSCLVVAYSYSLFGIAFSTIEPELQWMLVPVITLVRVIIKWMYKTLSYKAAGEEGKEKFSIQFATFQCAETRHAVFVSMIIGGTATPATSYGMIGADFLINIYTCYRIVKKYKLGFEGIRTCSSKVVSVSNHFFFQSEKRN